MRRLSINLFFLLLVVGVNTAASPPAIQQTHIPDYDYSQTRRMVFYGSDDYVLLGNPFENPAPNMAGLVYEIILLYVPQFQPHKVSSEKPAHVLDLMMKDAGGNWRLGQRLYLGNFSLSDGKSIAQMKPADYELLVEFLNQRYEDATHYNVARIKNLTRPEVDALPENWLPEERSVHEAIRHFPVSDYQRVGHDPGAQIRRK